MAISCSRNEGRRSRGGSFGTDKLATRFVAFGKTRVGVDQSVLTRQRHRHGVREEGEDWMSWSDGCERPDPSATR